MDRHGIALTHRSREPRHHAAERVSRTPLHLFSSRRAAGRPLRVTLVTLRGATKGHKRHTNQVILDEPLPDGGNFVYNLADEIPMDIGM